MTKRKAKIIGTGAYLPERVLTNRELEQMVETSDEWIVSRTGVRARRIASADEYPSDMGTKAARIALERASVSPEGIDLILVATLTPDYVFPSTACLIQKNLGAKRAAACDLQAACTGFLYALSVAQAFVESERFRHVLVVAAEKLSAITDYQDRSTCILFGDGAGACVVSLEGRGLLLEALCLGADGELADLLLMPAGGSRAPASPETLAARQHYIKMSGNEVFKHAVRRMEASCKECLERAQLQEKAIDWLIPHQANLRIIEAMAKRFHHLSPDRIFKTVDRYGNTSASSIIIALHELLQGGRVRDRERLLLTAFGGGLTWGAALLQYEGGHGCA